MSLLVYLGSDEDSHSGKLQLASKMRFRPSRIGKAPSTKTGDSHLDRLLQVDSPEEGEETVTSGSVVEEDI